MSKKYTLYTEELDQLFGEFSKLKNDNKFRIAMISSESKTGKTFLLQSLRERIEGSFPGVVSLEARGLLKYNQGNPYHVFRDLINGIPNKQKYLNHFSVTDLVKKSLPEIANFIPILGSAVSEMVKGYMSTEDTNTQSEVEMILNTYTEIFKNITKKSKQPLLMIIDDFQWIDQSSLEFVEMMKQQFDRKAIPVFLVGSYSSDIIKDDLLNLVDDWAKSECVHMIRLKGLSEEFVQDCIFDIANKKLNRNQLSFIRKLCLKRPYHVLKIANEMKNLSNDTQIENYLSRIGKDEKFLNETHEEMIRKLKKLNPNSYRILEECSVFGENVLGERVLMISSLDEKETRKCLRELCKDEEYLTSFHKEDGYGYTFKENLVFEIVNMMARKDQFDYHYLQNKAIQIMSANPRSIDDKLDLAALYEEVGDQQNQIGILLDAVEISYKMHAYSEVVNLIHTIDDQSIKKNIHFMNIYLESLFYLSDYIRIVEYRSALEAVQEEFSVNSADRGEYLNCLLVMAKAYRMLNRWEESLELARFLTKNIKQKHVLMNAFNLLGEINFVGPEVDFEKAIQYFKDACILADEDTELTAEYRALGHIGLIHLCKHEHDEAIIQLEKAQKIARKTGNVFDEYEVIHWKSKYYMKILDLPKALECVNELEAISDKHFISVSNPFHKRDASRIYGLLGNAEKCVDYMAQYLSKLNLSNADIYRAAIASILFQVAECHMTGRQRIVSEFITGLILRFEGDEDLKWKFHSVEDFFCRARTMEEIRNFIAHLLDVSNHKVSDFEAVFCFNVPDFWVGRISQK